MGQAQSTSYSRYSNDFELVVRATKDLEELLEKHFGAPDGKDSGLHEKITEARVNGQPLPVDLVRKLRYLVTIRNKLIHEHDCNAIPDRAAFVKSYDDANAELHSLGNINEPNKGCCVQ